MLNIIKFAHEKGREEGIIENDRKLVLRFLEESVGIVPAYIIDEVMAISRPDILERLVKQSVLCEKIEDFEKMLKLANRKPQAEDTLVS